MIVARTYHRQVELVRWLLLIALAALLATLWTARIAGATELHPEAPAYLPATIDHWPEATAMPQESPADFVTTEHAIHLANQLRTVIDLHENRQTEEAHAQWQEMKLPVDSAIWKELGLALTHMRMTKLDDASVALQRAEELDAEHPLVHYYRGILNLEYAYVATEYYDAIEPESFRFAGHKASETPQLRYTKGMYELRAMQDLERAIALGGNVFLEETLIPSYLLPADDYPPTVGELLEAWNAENFVARAHNTLGAMNLEKSFLERAEEHMDNATELGANVLDGYVRLGEGYEAQERHGDALRAYSKAFQKDPALMPSQHMLRNFGRSLEALW